jgi:catechol 2,3-dioxygenase-like lactoylglutathione lyase family enzyme
LGVTAAAQPTQDTRCSGCNIYLYSVIIASTRLFGSPSHHSSKGGNVELGYTIIYVPDVAASLTFFENAFGLSRGFLHESGTYGELATGETTLAFASHELGDMNFPGGHVAAHSSAQPLGFEVAFVTQDVYQAHAKAIDAGARELAPPAQKPWGQVVSYVRCPDGVLVELCTPVPI